LRKKALKKLQIECRKQLQKRGKRKKTGARGKKLRGRSPGGGLGENRENPSQGVAWVLKLGQVKAPQGGEKVQGCEFEAQESTITGFRKKEKELMKNKQKNTKKTPKLQKTPQSPFP